MPSSYDVPTIVDTDNADRLDQWINGRVVAGREAIVAARDLTFGGVGRGGASPEDLAGAVADLRGRIHYNVLLVDGTLKRRKLPMPAICKKEIDDGLRELQELANEVDSLAKFVAMLCNGLKALPVVGT